MTDDTVWSPTDEQLRLATEWHSGQTSMLYAIASTGALSRGTIRPSTRDTGSDYWRPMTDTEWSESLRAQLWHELRAITRYGSDTIDDDDDQRIAEEWLDRLDAADDDDTDALHAFYVADAANAYVECALWSSTDDNGDSFEYLNYDVDDIDDASRLEMLADVTAFIDDNRDDIADDTATSTGHDFWLTRNGHGAGFWDRGYGARGDRLTDAAHVYGESDIYVGDDGRLYVS